jgi:hypothetical protein
MVVVGGGREESQVLETAVVIAIICHVSHANYNLCHLSAGSIELRFGLLA